ncbi:MAG: molecular chaperone HtpG [Lachnospiraceae bacterium]|nr:molecular chaperone HtpG [Lachnospiraceae bacterium]
MENKKGNLSITSENIFPVIKKWLYSDHDIFLRELISNGCDAITKVKKLDVIGDFELPNDYQPKVSVVCDPDKKTLTISDNGIGMTSDEIDKYINQIAFSGATDFLERYKGKADEEQIIGHFGLGFYSAFMVSDTVEIDSLSFQKDAEAIHWTCNGGTDYEMTVGNRDAFGTTITLHVNEDVLEFCNEYRVREIIEKYCSFMPYEIYLENKSAEPKYETIDPDDKKDTDTVIETIHEEAKTEEKTNEDGTKEVVETSLAKDKLKILKRPVPVNDTNPLWTKNPSECTEEEYKEFYRKVFHDYKEPLFWIHLNMDYPFRLKGILYFPKINTQYDSIEGTIKLYNNQVFIADNIKEVIPEFLMLLKGVIDCPDLPLNVSRSALQNDGFVNKISEYITKKVADKLTGLCKTDHENYEKYWDDISPFVKYGCLKDNKFCDKMNDYILFKDINDNYITLPDLLKKEEEKRTERENEKENENLNDSQTSESDTKAEDSDKTDDNSSDNADYEKDTRKPVYYVTDLNQQSQYIMLFKEQDKDAVILDQVIDTSFISQLEQRNPSYKFMRIDAEVTDELFEEASDEDLKQDTDDLTKLFRKALANDNLTVRVQRFKNKDLASMINVSEESRRINDMMKMYGMNGMDMGSMPVDTTLVLNDDHDLVKFLLQHPDSTHIDDFCKQLYDLAMISNQPLSPDAMSEFINRSNRIMMELAK